MAAIDPDTSDANISAAAAPAPNPTSTTCIIVSCPASSAVRDGMSSVPTIGGQTMEVGDRSTGLARPCSAPPPPYVRQVALTDHVKPQSDITRVLDPPRQLPLFLGRNRRNATGHDLAALRHVSLQQLYVLVIDLRRVGSGKRTSLTPTKEGPAGLCWGHRHGCHSSVVTPGTTSSLPSRGVPLSRSRRCSS